MKADEVIESLNVVRLNTSIKRGWALKPHPLFTSVELVIYGVLSGSIVRQFLQKDGK